MPPRIRAALRCLLLCALPALVACGQVGELYQPPVEAPAEEAAESAAGPGGAS